MNILLIIIIILIIILIVRYNNKESFKNCKNNIIVKDSLKEHIKKTNIQSKKSSILYPNGVLPYNLNNTDQYNILNNLGIKNLRKRETFIKSLNKCQTIPYNSVTLLSNYDKSLDNAFTHINTSKYPTKSVELELPDIYLIMNNYIVHWSYETKYLNDKDFYLYYEFIDTNDRPICLQNFNTFKLNNNFESKEFKLETSYFKNRNMYKLNYNDTSKIVRLFIVLKKNSKVVKKSNNIKIKTYLNN